MRGAIPPLLNTPSWGGARLKKSTGTTLPLSLPLPLPVNKQAGYFPLLIDIQKFMLFGNLRA
jgi:hypothetical protein